MRQVVLRRWVLAGLFLSAIATAGAQSPALFPALRIVVIEGEDAINIIQQKTAVAPLVEVRDRNNLPVPGVAVTFTVGGQGASFGGLSTLTVTTNAAGQAAAVGLTPTAAGAVQTNAAAVFQGQTAVATITQTNVLTAAQAATAAGATGSASGGAGSAGGGGGTSAGGAAAGGGGLSTTTIVIAGAAVGGGALAATKLTGDDDDGTRELSGDFSGAMVMTFPGPPSCNRVQTYTGTMKIELTSGLTEGPVSGTASIEGRMVVSAVTCGGGPQNGSTESFGAPRTPVSGSAGAITFTSRESNTFPASGPSPAGVHTAEYVFTGTLSGGVITGTLTHLERSESPGSGFPAGTGQTTYAVTLR